MKNLKDKLIQASALGWSETSDFDLNEKGLKSQVDLKPAAVLIPFCEGSHGPQILLTKRSSRLKSHPGQVAFPGGKKEPNDEDHSATALREANEEVGLSPEYVEVLGQMAPHITVTGFEVTPVIGWIKKPWNVVIDQSEVAEAFYAQAEQLLKPENFRVESRIWAGTPRHYFTVPSGPHYIWGASARILRSLAERMSNLNED